VVRVKEIEQSCFSFSRNFERRKTELRSKSCMRVVKTILVLIVWKFLPTQILVSISLLTQILVSISLLKQILCKDFMENGFFFHAMSFWLDDCNCEFEKKIVNLMIVVGPSRVKLKCTPVHECTALLSLLNLRYLSS